MEPRYFINLDYSVPEINVEIHSEDGLSSQIFSLKNIRIIEKLLSKETLREYLTIIEDKMIEYSSSIVYDVSSTETSMTLSKLASIRDSLKSIINENK